MKNFILLIIAVIVGYFLSKKLLYIYDKMCYIVIGFCIKHGDERMQQEISKILGA